MKIAVLGATGATGAVFVPLALEAGHEVIALVRDASKLTTSNEKLSVVVGDATSAEAVMSVVTGSDVVVSCLGHRPGGAHTMMSTAFENILTAAATRASPPKCVLMTTMGVGGTSSCIKWILGACIAGHKVIADYEKADALVRNSLYDPEVPFVLVRPGHLVDKPPTNKVTVSYTGFYHIAMKITRADVAAFLLRAACSDEHDNKAVQLFT